MRNKRKPQFALWRGSEGNGIVKSAWNGTKAVIGVAVVGLALGIGLKAFGSAGTASN